MKTINRRTFLKTTGILNTFLFFGQPVLYNPVKPPILFKPVSKPELLKKEIFIPSQNNTGVFPGFITYIHKEKPILLHRFGWVNSSDTYDDFHESISRDNGKTWSKPVLKYKSHKVAEGRIRYCENTAFFDSGRNILITAISKFLYPANRFNQDVPRKLEISVGNPLDKNRVKTSTFDFGLPGGIGISFCFPIKTSGGQIIIPAFKGSVDKKGKFRHHPESGSVIYEVRMLIGKYMPDGSLSWRVGKPLRADPAASSRGFSESTPIELSSRRIALLCRGSNAGMYNVPGYKWLSFSDDDGFSWSRPKPLLCTDGRPIESSATGAACFRSIKNGKIYFIGNLCENGKHARGNWPRSPLFIAEINENPFALKRETIAVIDRRGPGDSPRTQISNFRYYQDRKTGDVVVFATRFGANDPKNWKRADYYRYRVRIG